MGISPDKQNIAQVFSGTAYHIDFYQRDYRWNAEPVLRLLDDIFFKFEEQYGRRPAPSRPAGPSRPCSWRC